MQTLAPEWQQHVALNVTQICHCLKIFSDIGTIYITNHDRPLKFDGQLYLPDEWLEFEPVKSVSNLGYDGFNVSTCIQEQALSFALVEAGFLSQAKYELCHVNWHKPSEYNLLKKGYIGKTLFSGVEIKMELHGLTLPLNNKHGRLLQEKCDAQFADNRCKIDASLAQYNAAGYVSEIISAHSFVINLPVGHLNGYFEHGYLQWQTGDNVDLKQTKIKIITQFKRPDGKHLMVLQPAAKYTIELNDQVNILVGCDKNYLTCRDKFDNGSEFRGFDQMPGKKFKFAYPQRSLIEE